LPIFIAPLLPSSHHHFLLFFYPFIAHTKPPTYTSLNCHFGQTTYTLLLSFHHFSMADLGSASSRRMWCSMPERMQLHVAMLALQFGYAGFHVVSRAALNMGVSKLVFPVYRNVIALLLLLPFAYFLEKLVSFKLSVFLQKFSYLTYIC